MKKNFWLTLLALLIFCQPVLAQYYQLLRTGDIVMVGTSIPLISNVNTALTCSTVSFKERMDTYYLIYDNEQTTNRYSLVGCEDYAAGNIFDPLISLNQDRILEKITFRELAQANVRFVKAMSPMGKLQVNNKQNDFNLNRIAYIDLRLLNYVSSGFATAKLYLKSDEKFENKSKYMKSYTLEIKTLNRKQANSMF